MKAAPVIASVPDDFDPIATIGHNQPPASPFDAVKQEIEDLFEEACHWADGEPISDQATHDAIEKLRDGIHEAGKRADALRVEEKKPLDDQVKAIQDRYNVYIQPKRGKVDLAKSTLDTLLTPWRTAKAAAAAQEAARVAAVAEAARVAAQEAMRASAGNLAAREEAEELAADAKRLEKTAKRADKAATVGTGLRTVWVATPALADNSEELRLEWAYNKDPARFAELVQQMASEAVRAGARSIPGFVVAENRVAI
ncbi:hypothetical protein HLI01_08970 [Rhizobium laguerreae]|uniref:hypothetical protein n=1 Tax=Rhizobium laguerreae TaxID=1076926 RepID=UPI001478C1FA|nr:hypothetical protein [Rhizobium laguerreae]NNH56938.1 hypothetical protein [Rhizobium laguerreae]